MRGRVWALTPRNRKETRVGERPRRGGNCREQDRETTLACAVTRGKRKETGDGAERELLGAGPAEKPGMRSDSEEAK